MEYLEKYGKIVLDYLIAYSPKVLLALVVLLVGLKVISWMVKVMLRTMEKKGTDPTLHPFLKSLTTWMLRILLFFTVIQMLGVAATSFIAVLGAASLAVGLALQGTLANFAGGALILILKPYKVGDLVETQGHLGFIKEIQIFNTIMLNPQNKTIILPNGAISNGNITNYTVEGKLRVDLTVGIAYESDIRKAKEVLLEVLKKDDRVLEEPQPFVGVSDLADSSINLTVRPWCHPSVYWDIYFDTLEKCKNALDEANITIPFPQVDVHIDK